MVERKTERVALEVLTDKQLECITGGDDMPSTCPSYHLPGRPWGPPGPSPLFAASVLNFAGIQLASIGSAKVAIR